MVQANSHSLVEETQENFLQRFARNVSNPSRDASTNSQRKVVDDGGNTKHGNDRQKNESEVTRVIEDQDRVTNNERSYVTREQKEQHDNTRINDSTDSKTDNRDKKIFEKYIYNVEQEENSTWRIEKSSDLEVMVTNGDSVDSNDDDDDDDGTPDGGWGYVVVLGTFIIVVCVHTINTYTVL